MAGERGFALIAILALAALVSAFLIASALNLTSAGVSNEREQRSMNALREAKAALIAYAANEQWQLYKLEPNTVQPGALPCPDIVHTGVESEEGDSDCVLPLTSSLIGRLPFKTIGARDLRDASGERLWYALSANFRKATGTTIINSDTQPCDTPACNPLEVHLTVGGVAPANSVVAVLFAPGEAIGAQTRSPDTTSAAYNNPANYLESLTVGGDGIHHTITTGLAASNDRVLAITQADLMAAVEPVVAARVEREVKPLFQDYFSIWGAYPFAKTFVSPPASQSAYQGNQGQTKGLLPVTTDPTLFTWGGPITVSMIPGDSKGAPTIDQTDCSFESSPLRVLCRIDYSETFTDRPAISIEFRIPNVHLSFANAPALPQPWEITMTNHDGFPLPPDPPPFGPWEPFTPYYPPTRSFQLLADGGKVVYTGRLNDAQSTQKRVFITILLPTSSGYLPRLTNASSTVPNIAWFTSNQWYKQTYYAVSPGYAPGGGGCNPLPSPPTPPTSPECLMVNNLPPSYANSNDKRAILVFAGRAMNGSPRPSGTLANYLEGANLTAANDTTPFVYEHRAGAPTAINDRVVVVSP